MIENSKAMGKVLTGLHQEMKKKHISVGDCRSIGLFGAIELVKNRKTKEPLVPFNGTNPTMTKVMTHLKQNGLYAFNWWGTLFTVPPLCVNEVQLKEIFAVIDQALSIADAEVDQNQSL